MFYVLFVCVCVCDIFYDTRCMSRFCTSSIIHSFLTVFLILQGHADENDAKDAPPASRFSAVIEKIERLYVVCDRDFPLLFL